MISDITFGQYYNSGSSVHRLDPRTKIILTFVFIIALFVIQNPFGYVLAIFATISFYLLAKLPLTLIFKNLKPLIPILIFTGIINVFFITSGNDVVKWGFFVITDDGIKFAIATIFRIIILIAGASILTYTTLPVTLTDGIESLLMPLKKINFPSHELAMMMTIALRFVPALLEEMTKIMAAQKSRGADFETGSIIKRAKSLIPILLPLFISSFKRAEDLSVAMEARCYSGGKGRTKLKELRLSFLDGIACVCVIIFFVALIIINLYMPKFI